jgi:hypothetical protein
LESAVILSSPYPVPSAGLSSSSVQVGNTYGVSVYPELAFMGTNQITIRYEDADLIVDSLTIGDESTIQIYQWDYNISQWTGIGGSVNAEVNFIEATITEPGVYGAFTSEVITDVEDDDYGNVLPYKFELSQNYPNPFNPVTTINYSLPRRSKVKIEIFNILGRKVITLFEDSKPAGDYQITWDGNDSNSQKVSTGIYFYRFKAGDYVETKKMLLLK